MPHYKIINTTRRPGVKKGKHRMGYYIALGLGDKRPIAPGNDSIVTDVTPGMIVLQQNGDISITPMKNLEDVIHKQIKENEKVKQEAEKERVEEIISEKKKALEHAKEELNSPVLEPSKDLNLDSGLDKKTMKEKAKKSAGKVTAAKVDGPSMDPLSDVEDALNPDGEPNFVVKAKRSRKR